MKKLTLKTWEGISSLAWTLIGYVCFQYWMAYHGFQSLWSVLIGVLVLWWGVGLTLAASGLRSRSRPGVVAGCLTVLGFLGFWGVLLAR
jgi:hypothetical protein